MIARAVIALVLYWCAGMAAETPAPRVVVERLSDWTLPPPMGGVSHADGRVSILYSDGRYALINIMLGRSSHGGRTSAILGEGYSVFAGCWTARGRSITAIAKPVYLPGRFDPPPRPVTLMYGYDGDFANAGKITPQGDGPHRMETVNDVGELLAIVESRTKDFESTSGSAVWSCSKQ
jgi:hypothetical protein